MVGLNAHEATQLRALVNIRRLISIRRFKGRPQEAILTIVFLVFAFPIPILFATFSGVAYRELADPWDAELLGGLMVVLWLVWLLAPVFGATLNDSPDMARLLTLPIRRRVMILATFAGSVFDYSTYFTVPFLIAALLGGWGGGAMFVVVLAVLIAAAHFIAAGQFMTAVTSGLARSRRFRDLATVIGSLLGLSFWWFQQHALKSEAPNFRDYLRLIAKNDIHPLNVLQWTPPGACARAIERASTGHVGEALLWLAGSAGALAGVVAVWWWALDRVSTQGEFSFDPKARRARPTESAAGGQATRRIPFLRPTVVAVAVLDMRQMWRNPIRRMQTLQGLLMPVVLGLVYLGRTRLPGPVLALGPAIFVTIVALVAFQNIMGADGRAVATLLLSPLDRRDVFRGKVLAFAAIAGGPVVLLCILAVLRAPVSIAAAGALLSVATFLIVATVSSAISARVAIPVPQDRRSGPVRSNSAAGWTISLLQPAIIAFLLAPFWIPAAIGIVKERTALALIGSAAGVIYAMTIYHFGIRNAASALIRREPEIYKMLDPKAT